MPYARSESIRQRRPNTHASHTSVTHKSVLVIMVIQQSTSVYMSCSYHSSWHTTHSSQGITVSYQDQTGETSRLQNATLYTPSMVSSCTPRAHMVQCMTLHKRIASTFPVLPLHSKHPLWFLHVPREVTWYSV